MVKVPILLGRTMTCPNRHMALSNTLSLENYEALPPIGPPVRAIAIPDHGLLAPPSAQRDHVRRFDGLHGFLLDRPPGPAQKFDPEPQQQVHHFLRFCPPQKCGALYIPQLCTREGT